MAALANVYGQEKNLRDDVEETTLILKDRRSSFNMKTYAAPAISNIRVGYIGIGGRGTASIQRLSQFEGVEIRAIADCYEYPIERAGSGSRASTTPCPRSITGRRERRDMPDRDDLDLIYVTTPQYLHAEMACAIMESGRHAACEVLLRTPLPNAGRSSTRLKERRNTALFSKIAVSIFSKRSRSIWR